MTVTFLRRTYRSSFAISTPSISIYPSKSSTILLRLMQTVDLPAPVLPTTPTFEPGSTTNVSFFKTAGVFGRYLRVTFLNSTYPREGHNASTSIESVLDSCGTSFKLTNLCTETICCSILP